METPQKAQTFWAWFEQHNKPYLFLSSMEEATKSNHLNRLVDELHQYSEHLYFEIGGVPDADQELIITAEGASEHFDKVKSLVAAAPQIAGWRFIAFVPPRGTSFELSFDNNYVLKAADLNFLPMENPMQPDALGLKIDVPDWERVKDYDWLRPAVFKILECILGEESFALDIQYVDISPLPSDKDGLVMLPLEQLESFIKWRKAQHARMVLQN